MEFTRPDPNRPKTFLIPALIVLIAVALVIFFLKGDPTKKEADPAPVFVETTPNPDSETPPEPVSEPLPAPAETGLELRTFTPWMAPSEIDAHIRLLGGVDGTSFWEKGHWIIGAEGRWEAGTHQFRIAYDVSPPPETYTWKYKINQTQEAFTRAIDEFLADGFSLVYSQSFTRPDDTKRYQGVWHRRTQAALPQTEEPYQAQETTLGEPFPATNPETTETDDDPLSGLNQQDFREASEN